MKAKLQHYLQRWELHNPRFIAGTPTSTVYIVTTHEKEAVLKLLTPAGIRDEKSGAVALEYYRGRGAVHLLNHDDGAHLLEYIDGDDLVPMVRDGHDEQAAFIISDTLNRLHSTLREQIPSGLISLRRRFRSLFTRAAQDRDSGVASIFVRAAPLAESLLDHPQDECVLHGDIHHENIRHHKQRGWLAFDPKGLYGERTYDAANTLCNPCGMPELVQSESRILNISGILAQEMRLERGRLLKFLFVYACLSASWSLEDGQDPYAALTVAELTEPHCT